MNRRELKRSRERTKQLLTKENRQKASPVDRNWAEFHLRWLRENGSRYGDRKKRK
jgi:hypothetical protein